MPIGIPNQETKRDFLLGHIRRLLLNAPLTVLESLETICLIRLMPFTEGLDELLADIAQQADTVMLDICTHKEHQKES